MKVSIRLRSAIFSFLTAMGLSATASATIITPVSYSYGSAPSSSYADTNGIEATDGVIAAYSFNSGCCNWEPYFGWRNTNGQMTFNFGGQVNIDTLTIWAADDDGYAGVTIPASVTIQMGSNSLTRQIVDQSGVGVREIDFTGLGLTGSSLTLTINPRGEWTMLTEVQFSTPVGAVPEPGTLPLLLLGGLSLAWLLKRRSL